MNWQYLWRDRVSGTKLLFIDPEMKDGLFEAADGEADRGKVSLALRRKFIELAAQPALRRANLLVYSDDADKASGNGWFDGVYNGGAVQYNRKYQAALNWIAAHPWVQAVTTADLDEADCVGELDLISASDPYIRKEWDFRIPPAPGHDHQLAYDGWYDRWAQLPAAWFGESLRAISDRAERALAARAGKNQLDELARLYLAMCLHESQWSKRARDPLSSEAEDFVIAESLQLRNMHVYLSGGDLGGLGADAGRRRPGASRRRPGDRGGGRAGPEGRRRGPPPWRRPTAAGLQWDHDPLPNVILYNDQVLVVVDRNGGRITHLFAMVDGRPVSLSGTFKAYQFLDWTGLGGRDQERRHRPAEHGVHAQPRLRGLRRRAPAGARSAPARRTRRSSTGTTRTTSTPTRWPRSRGNGRGTGGHAGVRRRAPRSRNPGHVAGPHDALDRGPGGEGGRRAGDGAARRGHVRRVPQDHPARRQRGARRVHRAPGRDTRWPTSSASTCTRPRCWVVGRRPGRPGRADRERAQAETPHNWGGAAAQPGRLAVRVRLGAGCAFTPATGASLDPPDVAALRLHRVMTDTMEVVAPDGGAFDYRIELP